MNIRNRLVSGVGINDADYVVAIKTKDSLTGKATQWTCPYYEKWASMLKRCYSKAALKHDPTYLGCEVCPAWLIFSNFKAWMEQQDWQGKQLDKDILGSGKLYSPLTCTFVSLRVNLFLRADYKNKYLPGVCYIKSRNTFRAQIYDNNTGKHRWTPSFKTQEEAYEAWKSMKIEIAKAMIIEENLSENLAFALIEKVNNI